MQTITIHFHDKDQLLGFCPFCRKPGFRIPGPCTHCNTIVPVSKPLPLFSRKRFSLSPEEVNEEKEATEAKEEQETDPTNYYSHVNNIN